MFKQIERFYYRHYLVDHLNPVNRILHFIANLVIGLAAVRYFLFGDGWVMFGVATVGYSLALIGHLFFEKNLPVFFKHPFMSVLGDVWMFVRMARGKIDEDLQVCRNYPE